MKLKEWMQRNKQPPGEICAPPMTAGAAADILLEELLDRGWYISYSCNDEQALCEVVVAVIERYRWIRRWFGWLL